MNPFPFNMVAFDLDGTLADTAPDLTAAPNHTLARLDRPAVDPDSVRHLVGHGAKAIYLDDYADHICVGTRIDPGLEAAMDILAGRGAALAICINKPDRLTYLLLEALGWTGRFAAVVGADTVAARKPDPRPLLEAVARAGKAAGLPFVAVSFGFSDRPVEGLAADAVIDDYGELVGVLERL